jgi:pimeloyl-ACP methyl ester carboxylesterase
VGVRSRSPLKELARALFKAPQHNLCELHCRRCRGIGIAYTLIAHRTVFFFPDVSSLEVQAPTLLIWGEADLAHVKTDRKKLPAKFSNLNPLYCPEAGHEPELGEPAKFARALNTWLV